MSVIQQILKMKLTLKSIPPSGKTHSATVLFFHGSGDTGPNLIEWVRFLLGKDLQSPHIKFVYPTAPLQPYTPLDGEKSHVWFDRKSISIDALESRKSLASSYELVNELIEAELNNGIPINRIVVGGFSMGGALALHTGYHVNTDVAGVFACSAFLNKDSIVYESLKNKPHGKLPELLMFHGDRDTLVRPEWGSTTFNKLQEMGVEGEFVSVKNTLHELKVKELVQIQEWLAKILPPIENDVSNKL
ncbi:hypothetical protein HA402_013663 [Bradysia odoriphaga]|nr:hypothetical protein HA402_013663 [Bradysia odoriphaga]